MIGNSIPQRRIWFQGISFFDQLLGMFSLITVFGSESRMDQDLREDITLSMTSSDLDYLESDRIHQIKGFFVLILFKCDNGFGKLIADVFGYSVVVSRTISEKI